RVGGAEQRRAAGPGVDAGLAQEPRIQLVEIQRAQERSEETAGEGAQRALALGLRARATRGFLEPHQVALELVAAPPEARGLAGAPDQALHARHQLTR